MNQENIGIGDHDYYQTWYAGRPPEFYSGLLQEIVRFGRPGSIVDLGCGVGLFTELAAKWGFNILGLDGSSDAVRIALERSPWLKLQHAVLSDRLPCSDQSFDNVVLNQVIEHLPPPILENALSESYRVLKNGGVLFIFSPSKANRREIAKDPTHCNPLYPSQLRAQLKSLGFVVVREPNEARFFGNIRVLRRVSDKLLRTPLVDWISGTANAYAVRP